MWPKIFFSICMLVLYVHSRQRKRGIIKLHLQYHAVFYYHIYNVENTITDKSYFSFFFFLLWIRIISKITNIARSTKTPTGTPTTTPSIEDLSVGSESVPLVVLSTSARRVTAINIYSFYWFLTKIPFFTKFNFNIERIFRLFSVKQK